MATLSPFQELQAIAREVRAGPPLTAQEVLQSYSWPSCRLSRATLRSIMGARLFRDEECSPPLGIHRHRVAQGCLEFVCDADSQHQVCDHEPVRVETSGTACRCIGCRTCFVIATLFRRGYHHVRFRPSPAAAATAAERQDVGLCADADPAAPSPERQPPAARPRPPAAESPMAPMPSWPCLESEMVD